MNRHPQTATDDPLVAACSLCSLAVSGCRKRKIPARLQELQLQIEVFICRNPQKEHHERIQIPSTEIPSGQQDRLSGVRQESLLHPLYRRGGRDFLPRQCGQVRPHQQLRLPLYAQRIFPGQSYRQREVGRTRKGWPGKVGSEDSTGTGAKNILSSL